MRKSNFIKLLALCLVFVLSFSMLVGCGGKDASSQEGSDDGKATSSQDGSDDSKSSSKEKDKLVVAIDADAKGLDPHQVNDVPSFNSLIQIYETLVTIDNKMEVHPGLATSWEQLDDKTWEFKLKEGVKFHNGEEMKASDVKFSFIKACGSAKIGHIVGMIDAENIEIIDDYTLRIPTKEPFAPFIRSLTHSGAMILSEKAVTEAGDNYGENPIGTGPFKFVEWKRGSTITFVRFDEYHGDKTKIKDLVFRIIPERTNRVIELETGAVDVCYAVGSNDVKRIEDAEDLYILRETSFSTGYLGMNCLNEPFNDVRVRQAINYALDIDLIVNAVMKGVGKPAEGAMTPNTPYFNGDIKKFGYDLERAKELMKEAGLENGFKCELWTNENKDRIDMAEIIQSQLKEIGIELDIKILEWGAYLDRLNKKEQDMFLLGWSNSTGDPDTALYAPFHSSKHGKGGNKACYTNTKVDELLDAGRVEFDGAKREDIYREIQSLLYDEAAWTLLYNKEIVLAANKSVKGLVPYPTGVNRFNTVTFE